MNFDIEPFLQETGHWFLTSGLQILLILILSLILIKLFNLMLIRWFNRQTKNRDEEYKKRLDTIKGVFSGLVSIAVFVIAIMMVLKELGVEIAPILASAGVVGVAVGFGAQHLVRDVINGFFILLNDEIRVGDVVQIAGKGGLVEKISLRMTILRDLAGNVHFVRNGEITVVTNMTKEYSRYVFDVGVAYREDVDQVIEVLKDIDKEMREDETYSKDILEPLEILGLDQFGDSAVIIKARTKTKPIRQWAVGREFNRRLKKRFDQLDIEIPFPHTTLYIGQDKDGSKVPFDVNMLGNNPHGNKIE